MLMTAAEAAAGSTASASSAISSGLSTADSLDTARSSRVPRRMRFFEFESRRIVAKGDIPVSGHGYATTPADARRIAESLGGPTVIKSQVLTGGRMKAGGVRFADSPEEAERHAADILELEINGHMPRGVLVDSRVEVAKEYYAGVTWDGTRKRPVLIFSDMGGIDIEEVADSHPDHVGRAHFSTLRPFSDYEAKQVIASVGVTGRALTRLTPILARLARLFAAYDMTLAEINPLAELADGSFVALDPPHRPARATSPPPPPARRRGPRPAPPPPKGEGKRGAPPRQKALLAE